MSQDTFRWSPGKFTRTTMKKIDPFYHNLIRKEAGLNKYLNVKVTVDGIKFDSKKEANRYGELKLLEKAKQVREIQIHPRFRIYDDFEDFEGKHHSPIYYEADFQYWEKQMRVGRERWVEVVEDTKGFKTEVYKLKKKMFLSCYKKFHFKES